MRFIFADSLDFVDPGYDFIADRNSPGRRPYWDDAYPHEMLDRVPYHGVLVSRGIIGDGSVKGKYSDSQVMRFKRVGARAFLRLDKPKFASMSLFGDCGAFTYVNEDVPPYTPADTAAFYEECGFDHGCSVDHIIFDFDDSLLGLAGGAPEARRRFDLTLENAAVFREEALKSSAFEPLGVVQGWSPSSMAEAARRLVAMGYDYLAVGGMVPLKIDQVRHCLSAIRDVIPASTRLHILGFGKVGEFHTLRSFGVTSFDTTSPLLRAFKDDRQNYWIRDALGKVEFYTAIRVPQSIENPRLQRHVKQGDFRAEMLTQLESSALRQLRRYDRGEATLEEALAPTLEYNSILATGRLYENSRADSTMVSLEARYRKTLADRPWKRCRCAICIDSGIEVVLFRASNRNKRRGIHNLGEFKAVIDDQAPAVEDAV